MLVATPVAAATSADGTLQRAQAAMISDPREVVALVGQARAILDTQPAGPEVAVAQTRALWLESEALGRLGDLARAEKLVIEALDRAERLQPNGKLHGDIVLTQGSIALDKNEMQRAFELFRRAHGIFRRLGDTRAQAIALQNIGTIYSYAGDQRSVLRYYAQAAEVHPGDPGLTQTAANNLGTAYRELGQLERADGEYRRALTLARTVKSPLLEIRALNNLASVALLRGEFEEAGRFADRGLALARAQGDADWTPFLWGVKGQIALKRGDVKGAIRLFSRTFSGVDPTETSFYFRDFHESASEAFRRAGDAGTAFRHLQAFKRLDDEAREIRSSTNAALSAAQFDYSNQELRIAKLREAEAQARARQQTLLLVGTLLLLVLSLGAFLWIRRSRNQVQAANVDLDKALRAKSEFLATTSHEIRTPLNGILGMTQVLLNRRTMDAGVRDQVQLIDTAGNTMKAIVDDILDMAQIEQGRVQVDRTNLALPELVGSIAGLWRPAAERKGVALDVDMAGAPPMIREDERKLRQITFNLLSNAIKFTSEGSVKLRIATDGTGIDERLLIAVRDSGIGIAANQCDLIFEPFRQADGGTTRQFGGTGLGLAIAAKLAAALGGTITVTSEVGVGSCFTLSLPLTRVPAPVSAHPERAPATCLAEAAVTLIEPNPLFASMTEACLEADVASVTTAYDTAELPPGADIVLIGDGASDEDVAIIRTAIPDALLVLFGNGDDTLFDGVVTRSMPPLHLGAALDTLLSARSQVEAKAA